MALARLTHKTIGDLDEGNAGTIIDKAINEALNDLDDRGGEDKLPRKVVIEVVADIKEDRLILNLNAHAKIPPRKCRSTIAASQQADGGIKALFQTGNAENPAQPTMFGPNGCSSSTPAAHPPS